MKRSRKERFLINPVLTAREAGLRKAYALPTAREASMRRLYDVPEYTSEEKKLEKALDKKVRLIIKKEKKKGDSMAKAKRVVIVEAAPAKPAKKKKDGKKKVRVVGYHTKKRVDRKPRGKKRRATPKGTLVHVAGYYDKASHTINRSPNSRTKRAGIAVNPRRRYKRNPPLAVIGANPRRRHLSRRRKTGHMGINPVLSMAGIKAALPLFLYGGLGVATTTIVPNLLKIQNVWLKRAAQVVVAVGGGSMVGRFAGQKNGVAFMIGGGSALAYELINEFILSKIPGVGAPVAAFPIGAYTPDSMGAYDLSAYSLGDDEGMGDEDEFGAYAY